MRPTVRAASAAALLAILFSACQPTPPPPPPPPPPSPQTSPWSGTVVRTLEAPSGVVMTTTITLLPVGADGLAGPDDATSAGAGV
ncbi:MAG TPA: hypothetical protein VHK88_15785, partial [Aquihabitans sp.]|nr:hypothetical protein [Aquihabitans sp.]